MNKTLNSRNSSTEKGKLFQIRRDISRERTASNRVLLVQFRNQSMTLIFGTLQLMKAKQETANLTKVGLDSTTKTSETKPIIIII